MNDLLKNISVKIGLTKIEIISFLFSLSVFVFGLLVHVYKIEPQREIKRNFDYNYLDSLFYAKQEGKNLSSKNDKKIIDSEIELSNFNTEKNVINTKNIIETINLNSASAILLEKLPGIGKKTAKSIIDYRQKNGNFKNLEELKKIKGIKDKKFNKLKNYLYIENN